MPWRSFAFWNAAGGISWATTIGLVAYLVGNTATSAITAFGPFGLLVVVFAAAGSLLLRRLTAVRHPGRGQITSAVPWHGRRGTRRSEQRAATRTQADPAACAYPSRPRTD